MPRFNDKTAMTRRRVLEATGAMAAGLAAPTFLRMSSAWAAYPERPLKIVVANTPGGPSDISARMMAGWMQQEMGGSVFREPRRRRRQHRLWLCGAR
jgi:tripartite-type tricarboxylate transporter receptor subunit TctC